MQFTILPAAPGDMPQIRAMTRALADDEDLAHPETADEDALAVALSGPHPAAEALIAWERAEKRPTLGFALFFPTFSTFPARRGVGAGGWRIARVTGSALASFGAGMPLKSSSDL